MTRERLAAGSGAVGDDAGVASEPESSRRNGPAKLNGATGNGQAAPTRAFEAPHKREKETFLTRLAGQILLSFWRTSSWSGMSMWSSIWKLVWNTSVEARRPTWTP